MSWENILKNNRELLSVIESLIFEESDFHERNARRLEQQLRKKFATNRVYVGFEPETVRRVAGFTIELNDEFYRYDAIGRLERI